jgi:hypothetical protein
VRWDRFFDDLEDQLASEWEAERAALDTEAERLRLSQVALRDRLSSLAGDTRSARVPTFELSDGTLLTAAISGLGSDWIALQPAESRMGAVLAPISAVVSIDLPHAEVLRSARAEPARASVSDRMTMGFVLRDLVRRRVGVTIGLAAGRQLTGTIDRAGNDHLDLALHEPGAPRRSTNVVGFRVVPFGAVAWIRLDPSATLL